jgi:pimeloyl-ACP methyl ester carboxylesterase
MIIDPRLGDVISEQTISVNGVASQVLLAGEGPPLVLLHGDGETPASWQWVFPDLARAHGVFAPCLPGHADTDRLQDDCTIDSITNFMSAYLETLSIDRCILVGSSLGGLVAIRLALAQPSRVRALVLLDTSGLGRELNPMIALMSVPGVGEVSVSLARWPLGPGARAIGRLTLMFARYDRAPASWLAEQRRVALVPGFLEASLAAIRAGTRPWGQVEIALQDLERLSMPTLVIWGANDVVVPLFHATRAMRSLQDGELVVISECGHLPHVERPQEFIAALDPFLARVPE